MDSNDNFSLAGLTYESRDADIENYTLEDENGGESSNFKLLKEAARELSCGKNSKMCDSDSCLEKMVFSSWC